MNRFIEERKNTWERLEDLIAILDTSSIRGLTKMEVREFGELYRRAAADLAIARAETRDLQLINYLNSLVIRAHGKIYRAESQGIGLIWNFFARELPQTFRSNGRYIALAFFVFTGFGILSFILAYNDLNFGDAIGLGDIRTMAQNDFRWWQRLNDANQIGSSQLLTNNIGVAFLAFAFGAFSVSGQFTFLYSMVR